MRLRHRDHRIEALPANRADHALANRIGLRTREWRFQHGEAETFDGIIEVLGEDRVDPDARSMATSGRGTGVVGYNVQTAVDDKHHLVVAHEVTNVGHDRAALATMADQARCATGIEDLQVVADRGYFNGEEILACEQPASQPTCPSR